jgi:hypothetical protein
MDSGKKPTPSYIDFKTLPELFPTHKHSAEFWEVLGRAVGTFGYLEKILKDAILAITAVQPVSEADFDDAYQSWLKTVNEIITDSMARLIKKFEKAVRDHPKTEKKDIDWLICELEKAKAYRDVICHGAWLGNPDKDGKSIPWFVKKDMTAKPSKSDPLQGKLLFETEINAEVIEAVRKSVVELACEVINVVTLMGYQFPGSNGPGKPIG